MQLIWNLNLSFGKVFDFILSPFAGIAPFWGLAVASFITGAVMVLIFKYISNQEGIRRTKARVTGYFLEVWIYKHEFSSVIGSVGRILKANLAYMGYAVAPLLVMIIPVIIIMAHLNLLYGFRPLKVGEQALVTVKFKDASVLRDTTLSAATGAGLTLETKPVRALGKNEVTWRLKGETPGEYALKVGWEGGELEKKVIVGSEKILRLAPKKSTAASLLDAFLNPGEKPLPKNSPAAAVYISYPETKVTVLGMGMHWIIVFFVLSVAAGFALKGVFKVEI